MLSRVFRDGCGIDWRRTGAPVTVDVLDVAVKVAALDVGVTTVSGVTADVVVCLAGCVALF